MFKRLWGLHYMYLIILGFSFIQTLTFFFIDKTVFYISFPVFLVVLSVAVYKLITMGKRINQFVKNINDDLDGTTSNALSCFSLPVIIVSSGNEIIWYNSVFNKQINPNAETLVGKNIEEFLGSYAYEALQKNNYATFTFKNFILDVYQTNYNISGEEERILCFVDLTELRKTASEYKLTRPVLAFVAIDNLDDLTRNLRDSERNTVISKVQIVLEEWFSTVNGISRRLSGEKYLFIFEERDLISFISNKFDILKRIRKVDFGDRGNATVSIGIGVGENFKDCEDKAAQALDMALGRGGDQVAIKYIDNTFKFFGGVLGGSQTSSRVRARMAASTILNMAKNSNNIVLMGHKFADLDCYGSSFALASALKKITGKSAVIALDEKTSLVSSLTNRLGELGASSLIVTPENAFLDTNENTLLIVLDTHRKIMLENPKLLENAGNIIVIDHHRKAVDFITDAFIFYHDPAASSASEMVCELIQYMNSNVVGRAEADALLSGICLDTKNYCFNTGVRTFEASAFLRKKGADPIAIKKMFSDSLDGYKLKSKIVATAEQVDKYIIAINDADIPLEIKKIVSAQAADELLNISDVKASFVISKTDDEINISARSFGECNVQIIMEQLGGGGHRTMAACQIKDVDYKDAKKMLIDAIHSVV